MTDTLRLTPHETLTIVSSTPEALVVEAAWDGGERKPPPHLHPAQEERFEVLEGRLHTRIGETERAYGAGETFSVPRGVVHQMWAPEGPARARWETLPALRTEDWFRRLDELQRAATTGPREMVPLLAEYDDVFRLAVGPRPVGRALHRALRLVGRKH